MSQKVTLRGKFALFDAHWTPKLVGQVNDHDLKIAKIQGAFDWHHHDNTDELFYVVQGRMTMHLRDGDVPLEAGDLYVVPQGVEHKPAADEECWILMIERVGTRNTGNIVSAHTHDTLEQL